MALTRVNVDAETVAEELQRVDEIAERVRIAGFGLAAPLLKMRQGQAGREIARVAARKGADHPEVAARRANLARTADKLRLFDEELSRARVDLPAIESEQGAGVWGRVAEDGKPVTNVTVIAYAGDKRVDFRCTDANGGFAMEVPSETPIGLSVRTKDGAERYRDPEPDALAPGEQRFREIDLARVEPPCEEPPEDEKPDDERFRMVDLVDRSQAEAMRILRVQGLRLGEVSFEPSPDRAGRVLSHDPVAGALVRRGDEVTLVIAESGQVQVPDVVGLPLAQAEATLTKADLAVGEIREVDVPGTKPGVVNGQQPAAGSRVSRGAQVQLEIGRVGSSEFVDQLANIAARDERLSTLNLDEDGLRQILVRLNATDKTRAEQAVALDNAQLREAAGLGTLGQARTLRAILRAAISRVD